MIYSILVSIISRPKINNEMVYQSLLHLIHATPTRGYMEFVSMYPTAAPIQQLRFLIKLILPTPLIYSFSLQICFRFPLCIARPLPPITQDYHCQLSHSFDGVVMGSSAVRTTMPSNSSIPRQFNGTHNQRTPQLHWLCYVQIEQLLFLMWFFFLFNYQCFGNSQFLLCKPNRANS